MARVFVNDSTLTDIADAIREKNDTEEMYKPSQMADVIRALAIGGGSSSMDGVSVSEIVMETSTTNTKQASDYIETLVNPNANTLFVYKKLVDGTNLTTFPNNQGVFVYRMSNPSNLAVILGIRIRGGGYSQVQWNQENYDFVLNVGDEFYMVEFK